MARKDLPILDLTVKLRDAEGNELEAGDSRIADAGAAPAGDERCPALSGGDGESAPDSGQKRPAECPRVATWYVKRHPIALSLYFQDGKAFLDWFDANPKAQEFVAGRFFQGLLFEPLHSLRVRAEDLHLDGLEGEFMARLLREAIAAHAQFHYDISHGREGFVLSFVHAESPFVARSLPVLAATLARNGFRIARLDEPVLEMRVGLQRFFFTRHEGRVYVANGLEALLNVIDSLTPPAGGPPDAPLALTVRLDAFVDHVWPVLADAPGWDATFAFALNGDKVGVLSVPAGKFVRRLHPQIFEGVFAAIPHDAFAALATSYHLPPGMSTEDWRKLVSEGPEDAKASDPAESGFALLWDFDAAQEPFGQVGIVVATQSNPGTAEAFRQYLAKPDRAADCAGGTLFLAASTEKLLTRMKESCARQSLSVLDWERGAHKDRLKEAQLATFVNPGAGLRELFLAGGAQSGDLGDFEPKWKQEYENAKAAMRKDGEKVFRSLPIFAYAGKAGGGKTVKLDGFAVSQGVAP